MSNVLEAISKLRHKNSKNHFSNLVLYLPAYSYRGIWNYCGYLVLFVCSVSWFLLGCQYQCKWVTGKTRLQNDL